MNIKVNNRPPFLSALCILTFIGSSIGFLGYFVVALFFEKSSELIIKYSSWHSVDTISPTYFTVLMAMFAISLVGAIRIWRFHRDGFFLYSIAQLVILLLPVIWIDGQTLSATNTIITLVLIIGYGQNWKHLK